MARQFVTRLAAAAVVIAAIGNAPARANENVAGALATVVGVAILGQILSNRLNDNDIDRATRNIYDRTYFDTNRLSQPRFSNRIEVQPRSLPRRANRALLPAKCLRRVSEGRVFGRHCLERNYGFTRSLPRECKIRYRAQGKKYKGYAARCLRRAGYRLASR